jgi:two-component system chemotaxis response regulator CheY
MKILHADDDAVCCEVFRLMLTTEGQHQVTTAGDGEEAWKLLTDSAHHFDLAVIDLMMPKLDGLGLVERIRATPATSALPVVLCTALNDRTTVSRAVQLGVSQYIVKPYKKAVVLERIHRIEQELTKATPCEPAAAVCERLGVPEAALTGLVKNLLTNIRGWATDGKNANDSSAFQRLAIAANGYKGSCLNLGLLALSDEMEAMEALLTAQAAQQQRAISLTAPPEVLAGLQRIQSQVERAVAAHHLGA